MTNKGTTPNRPTAKLLKGNPARTGIYQINVDGLEVTASIARHDLKGQRIASTQFPRDIDFLIEEGVAIRKDGNVYLNGALDGMPRIR